jgi:dTDP-4-amino-4,6-dideoxygalactose transaminase
MAFQNLMGIKPFEEKVWLARPSAYQDSIDFVREAYETNWMSTTGSNINAVENDIAKLVGCKHSGGTAALHMAMKLAGEKMYGKPEQGKGTIFQKYVFTSDVTFAASINPIVYEGGIPVFIDTEYDTWNMDPVAYEQFDCKCC